LIILGLAGRHFVPFAVFFFPIVKRFAVDLVHCRVSDFHFSRLPSQKEIDVVSFSIGSLHIHAGEIFAPTEVLQSIIVDLYQIESEILALVFNVEFSVVLVRLGGDILLYARRNISGANLFLGATRFRMFGVLRVFLLKKRRHRRKE
jgi:hypothetical protein